MKKKPENNGNQGRSPHGMRLDNQLLERAKAIATMQRSTLRAVVEQCMEYALPYLEDLYSGKPRR